jgi:hypothetical protein
MRTTFSPVIQASFSAIPPRRQQAILAAPSTASPFNRSPDAAFQTAPPVSPRFGENQEAAAYPIPPNRKALRRMLLGTVLAPISLALGFQENPWKETAGIAGAAGSATSFLLGLKSWDKHREEVAEALLTDFKKNGSGAPPEDPFRISEIDQRIDKALYAHGRHAALIQLHKSLAETLKDEDPEVKIKVANYSHTLLVHSRVHVYKKLIPAFRDGEKHLPEIPGRITPESLSAEQEHYLKQNHKQYKRLVKVSGKIQNAVQSIPLEKQAAVKALLDRTIEHSLAYHHRRGRI